jgi:cellulose synthase/poly-beta-1,6-N-acetylglucosamine synthase-like glycosyltransferase
VALTGAVLVLVGASIGLYAYVLYPAALAILARARPRPVAARDPDQWPMISITVPAYNEETDIAGTLDCILAAEYPADRRQVLVVSDASTDGTDAIVAGYAGRGVQLLRVPRRGGKTAAENAARTLLQGEIVINTDASVRIDRNALKPLVRCFSDPAVGVASGRDVSVGRTGALNAGEAGYVGYEMWVRQLETRVGSIVGASGCLYAIRRDLHMTLVPEALSRDFAAALVARERGFRAVSVHQAICYVPRITSVRKEYRRKVRTMTRGLETLWFKRHLLNPFRFRSFAWMLWSHKLIRWLAPVGLAAAAGGTLLIALEGGVWGAMIGSAWVAALALAVAGWYWPEGRPAPRLVAAISYGGAGTVAALAAWWRALRGELNPLWEPTRREVAPTGDG